MKKNYLLIIWLVFLSVISNAQLVDFTVQGIRCSQTGIEFTELSSEIINSRTWNFDDGTGDIEQSTHVFSDSGWYNVTLTINTASGYYDTTKAIYVNLSPAIEYFVDSSDVYFSSFARVFKDSSQSFNPITKYIWDFGDGGEIVERDTISYIYYKYQKSGSYIVSHSVIDSKGCIATKDTKIVINDMFIVPNVFTPNNDTYNDEFIVTSNGVTLFSIDIYNRWGNLLFRREGHQQIVWDGTMTNGTLVKPGTYFYVISATSGNMDYEPQSGFVTIFY